MKTLLRFAGLIAFGILASCQGAKHTFSLPSEEQSFQQNGLEVTQRKIDVLWVIDNSGSMASFQQNLTANFQDFIQDFVQKDYDFHMAVTTTDAYLADPNFRNEPNFALFKNGNSTTGPSGFSVLDSATPDIIGKFKSNVLQGATGSGDERAFSSFREALSSPGNSGFLRKGSFLAVIILSDEDDFSDPTRPERTTNNSPIPDQDYSSPSLEPVDSYIQFLDDLTGSSPDNRNYNVSSVAILDEQCLAAQKLNTAVAIIGKRMIELTQKTGGVLGDICSASYSTVLKNIQKKIIELSTEFQLNRRPRVDTIRITVNGISIPKSSLNGWTYNPVKNSIQFHGTAVPPKSAQVLIYYDPLEALKPQS